MTSIQFSAYKALMANVDAYLEMRISLGEEELIQVRELSNMLGGMADRYSAYVNAEFPGEADQAKFFIHEIRRGSIILEFVPVAVGIMDQISIIHNFWNLTSSTLKAYAEGTASGLRDRNNDTDRSVAAIVEPIAKSANGNLSLAVRERETNDGRERMIVIDAGEARAAFKTASAFLGPLPSLEITPQTETRQHDRVTMYFEQTNRKRDTSGKKTGEKVLVPQLDPKERALIYQSENAERQVKREMLDDPENIYHKAFLVDLYADYRLGRVTLYRLTHVHDVIDIDPDDEPGLLE